MNEEKPKKKRSNFKILLGIVVIIVIAIISNSCKNNNNSNTATEPTTTNSKYQIGDTINQNDILVTINGVRTTTNDGLSDIESGFKYVYIDVTITNNSLKDFISSSLLGYTLKDQNGRKLDLTVAINANGSVDGTVLVGDKLTGEVVFKAPADLTVTTLQVQANVLGKADQVELVI